MIMSYYEIRELLRDRSHVVCTKIEISVPVLIILISLFFWITCAGIQFFTPLEKPKFLVIGFLSVILATVFTSLINHVFNKTNERGLRKCESLQLSEIGRATELKFLLISIASAIAISSKFTNLIF